MMTIKQIYQLAIDLGINNDLRGQAIVKRKLNRVKKNYSELSEAKKEEFDNERLNNPFSDTRYFGNPDKKIKRVMAGIDIDVAELLVARELGDIDLIIAHHPIGPALAGLHEVMDLQVELMAKYGVPINVAESLTHIRMSEVSRGISPVNHNKVLDAARNLGMEVMCVHTPADNMVANFLDKYINQNKKNIETVGDVMKLLKKIPEYQEAIKQKAGPRLFTGKESRYAGRIALTEITGGTEGSKEIYRHIAAAGIGTIVGMHMKEDNREEAEKSHLNILIAGHMSSDSIGMNLFLDELVKRGVAVVPCSGLIRHSRVKKTAPQRKPAQKKKK
jgi:putative NIF3 family GTP cyclohydrolase 1 type 2